MKGQIYEGFSFSLKWEGALLIWIFVTGKHNFNPDFIFVFEVGRPTSNWGQIFYWKLTQGHGGGNFCS